MVDTGNRCSQDTVETTLCIGATFQAAVSPILVRKELACGRHGVCNNIIGSTRSTASGDRLHPFPHPSHRLDLPALSAQQWRVGSWL
jgi:hypothetical protein